MASDLVMPHYGNPHMGCPIGFSYRPVNLVDMRTIGERIRALRKGKYLTQPILAKAVGIDQSTLSDIERGAGFSAETLMRLADELETSAEFIMRGLKAQPSPAMQRAQEAVETLSDEERLALFTAIHLPAASDEQVAHIKPAPRLVLKRPTNVNKLTVSHSSNNLSVDLKEPLHTIRSNSSVPHKPYPAGLDELQPEPMPSQFEVLGPANGKQQHAKRRTDHGLPSKGDGRGAGTAPRASKKR
ncbi:MAG: helix-turn-helix domain-containing protein [Ramlibacter sp.]|nr:helix-turn-helix domain-containing protein [Ramlibacter sp.]